MYRYRPTGISSCGSERNQSNHAASALVQRPHEDSPAEPQAQPCGRLGIRVRELRCDLFSVNSLAAAMHVRKAEIRYWIEQGWLEAVRKDQGRSTCYNITPEALQRCLRERPFWQSSISSATCPSTLSGNNSFRCARRSGSRPRTTLQFPTAEREDAFASIASR